MSCIQIQNILYVGQELFFTHTSLWGGKKKCQSWLKVPRVEEKSMILIWILTR